ncbi:E3 ubiquitin-protein ligase SINA-like 10 [Miscanthus floridulus]|uniref:E3 ubiquitin-protein ligase SINA-like 10 n=1 Tax=Miscanthus floridulus TaxID=154761 RepID=UPI00345B2481
MERVQQQNTKKPRVELTMREVKQEVEEGQATAGAGAMVAVQVAAPVVDLEVRIEKAKLDCPRCTMPFKPPIFQFQCEAGHLACGTCYAFLPKNKCYSCHRDGAYSRSTPLEGIVGCAKVLCPYDVYGCRTYATYHEAGDHQRECPCAPCRCSEPGCAFVGSPPMLRDHLRDTHAWPVDKITYGRAHNIRLPETCPSRLLQAEDDGRVFLVSVGAHGARIGVTVACVRASAAAGPRYSCKLWATGNPGAETGRVEIATAEADVPSSSSVPGPGDAATAAAPLSVRRSMLHGKSMEMMLSIRIDKTKN